MNGKRKLLYIHPFYLPYYDFYDSFCLKSDSYVMGNINLKDKFNSFSYIDTKPWTNFVKIQKIFATVGSLKTIIKKMNFNFIITKEIFSPLSYKVSRINNYIKFKHIIYCDETTKFNNSLWGHFPITWYYAKYNLSHNNYYIASSKLILNNLLEFGIPKSNILLMRISVYPEKFKDSQLNEKCRNILFIGNLEKNKGIITLIRAFNLLYNKDIKLHIAGRGKFEEYVIESSKKNRNIVYHGYVTEEDKRALLSSADIFLYPSEDIIAAFKVKRWEEQGAVSALEAMASGVPVIGSDSGTLPEILGSNMTIEQGNYRELAKKILSLCSDYDLRREIHKENKEKIIQKYNINQNKIIFKNFLDNIE